MPGPSSMPARPTLAAAWRDPWLWLATGAGAGCAPRAPGTCGTLLAVPLYLLLADLPLPAYLAVVALLAVAGIPICARGADRIGVADPPAVVWDEIAGFLLTMAGAPAGWAWMVAGFCWFRLFDIVKPWPVRVLDRRVKGGLGIMLDDLAAAVLATTCLHLTSFILYSYAQ